MVLSGPSQIHPSIARRQQQFGSACAGGNGAAVEGAGAELRREEGLGGVVVVVPDGPANGRAGEVDLPGREAAAAAADLRGARRPARDGAQGNVQGRAAPRLCRVRRAQGGRAVQGRLLPRLLRLSPRHPPRLAG